MCSRRIHVDPKANSTKRQEREIRQQEKKAREKKTYPPKNDNYAELNNQLRPYNLQLRNIIGDGNCLFRSFADQMDGNQHRHAYYREKICNYMRENRADFEPFIVDEPFDTFMRSLSKDGTFGGNECLVAFSRLFDARICIHQLNQPVWIVCFPDSPKHEIHISYHDYEHYSSVRRLGDQASASSNIRQMMTTCDVSSTNQKQKKTTHDTSYAAASIELYTEHDVDYILSQIPNPVDPQLVRDTLNDNNGDIDGTIAYLLALDMPPLESPAVFEQSNESVDKIMSVTGIYDVDIVQSSLANNNLDIDSTVNSLLKLTTNDNTKVEEISDEEKSESEQVNKTSKAKNRPVSSRQTKIDKKKAKKQRAMEKHRAQILATTGKTSTKETDEKQNSSTNNGQDPALPVNLEFINI